MHPQRRRTLKHTRHGCSVRKEDNRPSTRGALHIYGQGPFPGAAVPF